MTAGGDADFGKTIQEEVDSFEEKMRQQTENLLATSQKNFDKNQQLNAEFKALLSGQPAAAPSFRPGQ